MTKSYKMLLRRAFTYRPSDYGPQVCIGGDKIPLYEIKEMSEAFKELCKIKGKKRGNTKYN